MGMREKSPKNFEIYAKYEQNVKLARNIHSAYSPLPAHTHKTLGKHTHHRFTKCASPKGQTKTTFRFSPFGGVLFSPTPPPSSTQGFI